MSDSDRVNKDTWLEYKHLVITTLERDDKRITKLGDRITEVEKTVEGHKVKLALIASLPGLVMGAISIIISFLDK